MSVLLQLTMAIVLATHTCSLGLSIETILLLVRPGLAENKDFVVHPILYQVEMTVCVIKPLLSKRILTARRGIRCLYKRCG